MDTRTKATAVDPDLAAENFLSPDERNRVKAAIRDAEMSTSGEIRVHLEDMCEEDVLDRAAFVFQELGMHRTKDRNGVIIYVSVIDHKVAVIGDAGINAVVPDGFWTDVVGVLRLHFAGGRQADGLCEAAGMIGQKLKDRFPHKGDDQNELSDDISIR